MRPAVRASRGVDGRPKRSALGRPTAGLKAELGSPTPWMRQRARTAWERVLEGGPQAPVFIFLRRSALSERSASRTAASDGEADYARSDANHRARLRHKRPYAWVIGIRPDWLPHRQIS